jgi:hypothetical protein
VPAAGAAKKLQSQHSQQHTKGRMTGSQPSQTFTKQYNGSLSSPKSACQDYEGDVPLNRFKQAARRIVVSLNPNSIELSAAREISNSDNWTGCQRSLQNNRACSASASESTTNPPAYNVVSIPPAWEIRDRDSWTGRHEPLACCLL